MGFWEENPKKKMKPNSRKNKKCYAASQWDLPDRKINPR
jgi:hypothetical protein